MRSLILMTLLLIPVCSPLFAATKTDADIAKADADTSKTSMEYETDRIANALASARSHIETLESGGYEAEDIEALNDVADAIEDPQENWTLNQAQMKEIVGHQAYVAAQEYYNEEQWGNAKDAWTASGLPTSAKAAYSASSIDYASVANEAEAFEQIVAQFVEDLEDPE